MGLDSTYLEEHFICDFPYIGKRIDPVLKARGDEWLKNRKAKAIKAQS